LTFQGGASRPFSCCAFCAQDTFRVALDRGKYQERLLRLRVSPTSLAIFDAVSR
jgi:hypothetical protein